MASKPIEKILAPNGGASVVADELLGRGRGESLCRRIVADAGTADVEIRYLLTTSAECFFARLGLVVVERSGVPAPIRAALEFRSLCPATAARMARRLS